MALITKVNEELRVDSTCSHAHKPKKAGCSKPEPPGLASGGCCFEGAYFALAPCSDALHFVHGPMTCLGSSWETRHTPTSWEGRDYTRMGFTSDMSDLQVVYALPDLSTSLDGYLGENQATLCQGGIRVDEIRGLGAAGIVITIGASMHAAGQAFMELQPQARHLHFEGIMGLQASDDFVSRILKITGVEPEGRAKRWRQRLRDAMIDSHFHIGKSRFILAGEPDRISDMARALAEVGGKIRAVVASTSSKALEGLPSSHVMVGDLEDVEAMLDDADVLICNMHGQRISQAHDKVYVPRGYPIYEQIGVQMKVDTLYEGGTQFLNEVANAIINDRLIRHPH